MSIEQPNAQMPEENPVDMEHAEKFDAEGQPRATVVLEDGEVFYGSEKEVSQRLAEKREEMHNK